jgi:tRNA(fMet)-specific endonuclease VapC
MKYLLDTNVLSEAVKTAPDMSVMEMFQKYQHEIVTAAPVWHELQFGCQRLPEPLNAILSPHSLTTL